MLALLTNIFTNLNMWYEKSFYVDIGSWKLTKQDYFLEHHAEVGISSPCGLIEDNDDVRMSSQVIEG